MKQSPFKLAILATHQKLKEMSLKEVREPFSSSSRGPIHEDRRLQIEELDEWRTHKLRTHDKPKLRQNELNTFPNQLKVGDKVLLDAADPHIVKTKPNEEIPLTVLSIFPFGTVEVSHPKFSTFKYLTANLLTELLNTCLPHRHGQAHGRPYDRVETGKDFPTRATINPHSRATWPVTMSSLRGKKTAVPASKKKKGVSSSSGPTAEIRHPFQQFPIGPQEEHFQILRARPLIAGRCIDWPAVEQVQLADAIRVFLTTDPWEIFFGIIEPTYLELTMELCSTFHLQTVMTNYDNPCTEFKEENDLDTLNCHIHRSPSRCWDALVPGSATYNPSRSKASALPPYLSNGVFNTHDAYFLWCISHGHVIDLAYFITLAIQHQTERHRKGVISIGPYVTRLARHFGLLTTAAQESSLNLIGQMSPQGISSMLSMRMIEKH
ncbi:hypothetical protein GOBAR_AA09067 [Gossypium barbadense]|uniref:Uncharacterized protein n=1 Tax=Gossypium barbadense TaxID=3634 RepID=A0A2P5Y7L4_GOSBA|nr:hypothetical protein GOBAR_AA09067 [Gossypium barbadense]